MTLQAPAIIGVRPGGFGASEMMTWLRGIGVRQVRIACGLIMFSYIFSHFFNHALGNISYATMEAWLWFHIWWWRIPIVNFTLYAAATTHLSLGLWALYQRRHFRYTAAEISQIVLGFSVPLLLASHFGVVRVAGVVFGRDPNQICDAAVRLLGPKAVHDRGAVRAAARGVDARLHRPLFLAAAEAVFQMGRAYPARRRDPAAVARHDRRSSRGAGGP
jgi:hypothetical protein